MSSVNSPVLNIIIGNQYNPYLNLAVESSILNREQADIITMFLWKNRQTVVIGANQNPYTECNVDLLLSESGLLARRRTGGGAVYHDLGNLNFSFIADKSHYDVGKQLSVIQQALLSLGLETKISGRNDITCQERKFSGNAFCFTRKQGLHHGTILIKTDAERLQKYLRVNPAKLQKHGVKSVASRIINLSEIADISSDSIIPYLINAFEKVYRGKAANIDFDSLLTPEVLALSEHLQDEKYLFGKWKDFHAKRSTQFPWGRVELDLNIDESCGKIREITIASDSLRPAAIETAEKLLRNADIKVRPSIPQNEDTKLIKDIFDMIY